MGADLADALHRSEPLEHVPRLVALIARDDFHAQVAAARADHHRHGVRVSGQPGGHLEGLAMGAGYFHDREGVPGREHGVAGDPGCACFFHPPPPAHDGGSVGPDHRGDQAPRRPGADLQRVNDPQVKLVHRERIVRHIG